MCAIFGIVSFCPEWEKSLDAESKLALSRMGRSIESRGPDGKEVWAESENGSSD